MTRDEQRQQQQQRIDKVRYVKLALEGGGTDTAAAHLSIRHSRPVSVGAGRGIYRENHPSSSSSSSTACLSFAPQQQGNYIKPPPSQ